MNKRKIAVIGDGFVGSSIAYTLFLKDYINEIDIIDINQDKVEGDVLDMLHGLSFTSFKKVKAASYKDIKDAHVVIITAGANQKEGETRIDLLKRNIKVFDGILSELKPYVNDDMIILVVSNPVDVLSYYTYKKLGIDSSRVIGSGTVLDTARLRYLISKHIKVDTKNIHTFVIGEHGDSEVCAFSVSSVSGIPLRKFLNDSNIDVDKELINLSKETKDAAYEIIKKKGSTYYAIALSVERIVSAILNNTNSILTLSTYLESEFNDQVRDVYLSLPCIVNAKGIVKIVHPNYDYNEVLKLIESYKALTSVYKDLNL